MDLPLDIKANIEELSNKYKTCDLISCYNEISSFYLRELATDERLIVNDIRALTYAITRMGATYGAITASLKQFVSCISPEAITFISDFGSGTGNVFLAAPLFFPSFKKGVSIERETSMIELAKKLNPASNISYINSNIIELSPETLSKSDLVTSAYTFNELNPQDRKSVLDKMFKASNEFILIVEPGTTKSFLMMKEIRDYLLNKGMYLVAPCPHVKECPMSQNDWCHFKTRVSRSRLHKLIKGGDAPYEDEKFTFLAFCKHQESIINKPCNRVIRHPLTYKGRIELTLCNKNGDIENIIVSKSNKENYKKAKKVMQGDEF